MFVKKLFSTSIINGFHSYLKIINQWTPIWRILKWPQNRIHFHKLIKENFFMNYKKRKSVQSTIGMLPYMLSLPFLQTKPVDCKENSAISNKDIAYLVKQGKMSRAKDENANKTEMFYLRALHLALDRDCPATVAHIQDLLANLALENNQLEKAEVLFRKVMQNLISAGRSQNDPAILEISLKLASIYARLGKKDLAITGYEWVADVSRKNLDAQAKKKVAPADKEYINSKALLGMILDSFGRFLHDIGQYKKAISVTSEAISISKEIFGEKDGRTLVIYNDLSSIKSDLGDYDGALQDLLYVRKLSEADPNLVSEAEKAVFYTNLSYIYIKKGETEKAEECFKRALVAVSKTNDDRLRESVAAMVHLFNKDNKDKR